MKNKLDYKIFLGTMSGTSLDGLDMCAVVFTDNSYEIIAAETISYPKDIQTQLTQAHELSGLDLHQLDVMYGYFCGKQIVDFINRRKLHIDFISSHGHTFFHTPHTGLTVQIGSGAHLAATTGISVISDFRTLDVAHGGQGAPLVPIGDEFLFSEFDYCLNIGGFANVSSKTNENRIAWDICAANIVLNQFALQSGKDYDYDGNIGKQGKINNELLQKLNALAYYSQIPPKSLGREWVEKNIMPIFNSYSISLNDMMRTYYEHIAQQIGKTLSRHNTKTLCTGGGTHNSFLMYLIQSYSNSNLIIPSHEIIDFKEALIFAYLGYLRVNKKPNCLASVTGATKNVCGGVIWEV